MKIVPFVTISSGCALLVLNGGGRYRIFQEGRDEPSPPLCELGDRYHRGHRIGLFYRPCIWDPGGGGR